MRSHSAAAACGALRCQAPYSDVCLPYHLAHTGSQLYPHLQMGKLRHGVATCPARYHMGGRGGRPGAAKALSGVEGGPTGPGGPRTEVGAQPHPTCAPTQSRGRPGRGCADQGVVWVRTDAWGSSEDSQQQSGGSSLPPPPGIHRRAQPRAQEPGGPSGPSPPPTSPLCPLLRAERAGCLGSGLVLLPCTRCWVCRAPYPGAQYLPSAQYPYPVLNA